MGKLGPNFLGVYLNGFEFASKKIDHANALCGAAPQGPKVCSLSLSLNFKAAQFNRDFLDVPGNSASL